MTNSKTYKGKWSSVAVPGSIGLFFLLLCGFGLLICFTAGIKQTPSPVHLACMVIMAIFLGLVGVSFVKVAMNGYISEVVLTDEKIVVKRIHKTQEYLWTELKILASGNTGLSLTMHSGAEIELGPSLNGFDELVALVKGRYNEMKGIRGVPAEYQ